MDVPSRTIVPARANRSIADEPARSWDVVVGLNYYHPYVSGLSELARAVAEHLAASGLRIRVVTSRHDPALPRLEVRNGVEIERIGVLARIRNGVVSPTLPSTVARRSRSASLCHLHLPMLEAGLISNFIGRRPLLVTYHCDYQTEHNVVGQIIRATIDRSSRRALRRADAVAVTSLDYARNSRMLAHMEDKLAPIAPPYVSRAGGTPTFRDGQGRHIGALGRIVEEKGFDYLIQAFRQIHDPNARLLIAGDYTMIAGQSVIEALRVLAHGDDRISFLGFLPDNLVADFFASLDVFAFPSVNPLEAFGITQLEALSAGLPIVASDLPGVRQPVKESGRGVLVPARDIEGLAAALSDPALFISDPTSIGPPVETAQEQYEALIRKIIGSQHNHASAP